MVIWQIMVFFIDFIKIDVEDAESLVLEGLRSTLMRHHPLVLIAFLPCKFADSSSKKRKRSRQFDQYGC